MQAACQHHQQGELDQAEEFYHQVLRVEPQHADALHLLGVAAHQRSRHEAAVDHISRAIAIKGRVAPYHSNLGTAYSALGRIDQAIASFRSAVQIDPDYADAQFNLATLLQEQGRLDEAIATYHRLLELRPDYVEAHNNLGVALGKQGQLEEAVASYQTAVELQPNFAEAHNNVGTVLQALGRFDEALKCHQQALALRPEYPEACFNLGNIYKERQEWEEAIAQYRRVLEIDSSYAAAYVNLGLVYKEQCRLEEAVVCNSRAIEIQPDFVEAHVNRAFAHRLMGDLAAGWDEYDWRFQEENLPDRFRQPIWDGSDLKDCTLLVYGEQGVGDEIMFASCIPDLLQGAGGCIVECDPRLVPLFARSFLDAQVVPGPRETGVFIRRPLPPFDVRIPMGSVPRYTRRTLDSFPNVRSYLVPDAEKKQKWQARLAELGEGLKVGISWRGGRKKTTIEKRTTTLDDWLCLFGVPNACFVNLQYGECSEELSRLQQQHGVCVHDWDDADPLTDLDSFAAQIAALDLVISADNSTVHMAGAVGVPVWTLLPFAPDWRWMLDRSDTPWYPSMRLFRQPNQGDWDRVLREVADALAKQAAQPLTAGPVITRKGSAPSQPEQMTSPTDGRADGPVGDVVTTPGPQRDDQEWLVKNCSLRMDANCKIFPNSRREFHLGRYRFAAEFCAGRDVLDAACGTGYGSALLGETARTVRGADISDDAIDYATRNYRSKHITFHKSIAEFTPFASDSFDLITSFETLEHLLSPRAAFAEFVRVLRKEGTAILSVPNSWGFTLHHFIDFNLDLLRQLTEEFFVQQEFFYNNSGDKAGCTPMGIGPLSEIAPQKAECIIAVCRGPRKDQIAQDRLTRLFREIYASAFQRHHELLALRQRSFAPFPDETCAVDTLPVVRTGERLILEADNLPGEPGKVFLQLAADVETWNAGALTIRLPHIEVEENARAQLHIVCANGAVAGSTAVRLLPPQEQPPHSAAG
jgi:tetratricopeptide (TPR) repeat protein/SAM-dependent methyltransferase